jgi:SAM-dependent methyltransferase
VSNEREWYNKKYNKRNYFGSREWLYGPYISSLVSLSGLKAGFSVLDAGCGQGFFSYLFHRHGLKVCGIDLSETGIRAAQSLYGSLGIRFVVGDIRSIPLSMKFDCVFTRACSLYNSKDFIISQEITDRLLGYVREGGTFIFAYNTKLNPMQKSKSWMYHTLGDVQRHFSRYPLVKIYVVNRLDMVLIGKYALNLLFTRLNAFLSTVLGIGVEFICILRK